MSDEFEAKNTEVNLRSYKVKFLCNGTIREIISVRDIKSKVDVHTD